MRRRGFDRYGPLACDTLMTEPRDRHPVLILGAGINGCAVARDLVLNGVSVYVVDKGDICCGTSARSSRLIHGGVRYLEYGDLRLVGESLRERSLLLRLAPQFVKPLRLSIPVTNRTGGMLRSVYRFLGLGRSRFGRRLASMFPRSVRQATAGRGLWLIRAGLWLYDFLSRDPAFPKHRTDVVADPSQPQIDANRYRWLCSYTDAQMLYPERFVLALLDDARRIARAGDLDFRVLPYHHATLNGKTAVIRHSADDAAVFEFEPSIVVNATGAWGDLTLKSLCVPSRRLFGGTKGSHFFTRNETLRRAVNDAGIYVEAPDGRLVFVLPCLDGVLVGTTDERFDENPDQAVASQHELDYLLDMVNRVMAGVQLTRDDVEMHYSGVRPLPYLPINEAAAIPRGHWIEKNEHGAVPVLTLIGGKLTTCRSLAEEVTDRILKQMRIERTESTRDRTIPGGESYPESEQGLQAEWDRLANQFRLGPEHIKAIWSLCGNRVEEILAQLRDVTTDSVTGTHLPIAYIRWVIENEWVASLNDLVERRLMLVYHRRLTKACLRDLAQCLVEAKLLQSAEVDDTVQSTIDRLHKYYGKTVVGDTPLENG